MLAAAACEPTKAPLKTPTIREPQISATVVTIQTTLQPQSRTYTHAIVIANGHARSGDEVDRWRLIDFDQQRVTFVDDIDKTYYTEPIDGKAIRQSSDEARPQIISTGAKRIVQGVETTQLVMRLGGYQRELWIGNSASIPPNLFGMINATDEALSKIRGFPFVDHAELPYGNTKMVVDRTVVKIEQRDVPRSWLNVGADYKEITAPGESRPPASSPPQRRSIRAMGSRFFSTIRKTP